MVGLIDKMAWVSDWQVLWAWTYGKDVQVRSLRLCS